MPGRLVMGYQGWFGCPGDFEDHAHWTHWFHGSPSVDRLLVDMLPAVDDLALEDRCDTGLVAADGRPVQVFSSLNPRVVDLHWRWMASHGVGAVALQRFVVELADERTRRRLDRRLELALQAAARHGVPLFISYDVSGAAPEAVVASIEADWRRLQSTFALPGHAGYLHDGGKPVLQLWGLGFADRPGHAEEALALVQRLRRGSSGSVAATLVGGVPSRWRTLDGDARSEPGWAAVHAAYDVISPWTVGRFVDEDGAAVFHAQTMAADRTVARARGQRYLPVLYPGFSWTNLMRHHGQAAPANAVPRRCGRFLVRQAALLVAQGADMAYGAMFDELDEATAWMPSQPTRAGLPAGMQGVALDQDGCAMAPDAYMRMAADLATGLQRAPAVRP